MWGGVLPALCVPSAVQSRWTPSHLIVQAKLNMRRLEATEEITVWPLMHRPFTSQQPYTNPLQVSAAISPSNESKRPCDTHIDTHQTMSGME